MTGRQEGFTLTELLVVTLVLAIALTLGATAFTHYWKVRALSGAVDEVVTELRGEQQDASTQTHPWVWGAWFKPNSSEWGTLRAHALTGVCEIKSRRTFSSGVRVASASFSDVTSPNISALCATQADPAAAAGIEVVVFFARGTATGGTVSLSHPSVNGGAPRTITVAPMTGRVTRP
ncbi:MAG TPA: prepilin-type N-terminal cleavage/methylation domain-containing protein [Actinomycetota bacterium]|nr:prepilin-type N-terminal cleavage/methylation domain-containing protein [Actinomycetota bacterium]